MERGVFVTYDSTCKVKEVGRELGVWKLCNRREEAQLLPGSDA